MTPLKSPLLSLGAKGTVGEALTYQERQGYSFAREKPIPAYRRSLPQQYQRWLYQDYAYWWTQQSEATQRQYHALGSRHHMTGFAYWMSYNLKNLPDIAGWWRMDDNLGITTIDSSRNGNTAAIIGASPTIGRIDGALSFDILNDYLDVPDHPTLHLPGDFTIEIVVTQLGFRWAGTWTALVCKWENIAREYILFIDDVTRHLGFRTLEPPALGTQIIAFNTEYHLAARVKATIVTLFVNGQIDPLTAGGAATYNPSPDDLQICRRGLRDRWGLWGTADNAIMYYRALDDTEILRHSERRYPA